MRVERINSSEAHPMILNIHYAKRLPSISYAFGIFYGSNLEGVVTYGMPASPFVCSGICGEEYKEKVIELNRLVLRSNKKNEASFLISNSIKLLPKPMIIVSYADSDKNHSGYVYQASNFFFGGTSSERTDIAPEDGKHPRHHLGDKSKRVKRSAKHRYFFIHASKTDRKKILKNLRWKIEEKPPKQGKNFVSEKTINFCEQKRLFL